MSFLFFDFAYMYSFHIIYSYLSPCRSFSCPFDVPLMPCLLHQAFLYCQRPALQCLNIFWTLYWRSQLTSKLFPNRVLAVCPVCTWGLSNQKWMAGMQILMQSERGCKTLYHDTFITFTMVIVAVVVIEMSYSGVQLRSLKSCWSPGSTLKKTCVIYLCCSAPVSAKRRVTQATVLWCTQAQKPPNLLHMVFHNVFHISVSTITRLGLQIHLIIMAISQLMGLFSYTGYNLLPWLYHVIPTNPDCNPKKPTQFTKVYACLNDVPIWVGTTPIFEGGWTRILKLSNYRSRCGEYLG